MTSIQTLWTEWKNADDAWSAALARAFGKNAGDARYATDISGYPEECRTAHDRAVAARRAFMDAGGFTALFPRKTA